MGVRCKANFPHCWVPPPSSSWLASCCFFRSSFSFSFTGSGTGMSNGAFRLLRLASLRSGSWHRVGGRLEARASSWPLSPYSLAPCSASVPLKMHPTQKSSWGNSSQAGSLSVNAVEGGEVGGRGVSESNVLPRQQSRADTAQQGRAKQWELSRDGALTGQVLPWYTGLHGTHLPAGHGQPFRHLALWPVHLSTVPLGLCRAWPGEGCSGCPWGWIWGMRTFRAAKGEWFK